MLNAHEPSIRAQHWGEELLPCTRPVDLRSCPPKQRKGQVCNLAAMKSWKLLIPCLAAGEDKAHILMINTFNFVEFASI